MNSTNDRSLSLALLLLVLLVVAPARGADQEEPLQNPALKPFYSELRTLFHKYYPKATSHLLKDKIHFEYDTRVFVVHIPNMSGEWQDPWEEQGPKPGGILCDITLEKGRYEGQAMVPQKLNRPYFKILLMAPYSPKHNAHLSVHLYYPRDVKAEFLKEFCKLADDFEKYLD